MADLPIIRFTSPDGHKMAVKRMKMSEQLDFLEACGRNSGNAAWRNMAMIVCSIVEYDDAPVIRPNSVEKVKTLIDKVGDDGYYAAVDAFTGPDKDDAAPQVPPVSAADGEIDMEIAKN